MKTESVGTLRIKRLIKAPIARVFAAWTTPAHLVQWLGPGPWKVTSADVDLRVGGTYRIRFHSAEENRGVEVNGTYREVKAPSKLVFTWVSPTADVDFGPTVVTVDLVDISGSTEVLLTHAGFPADPIRERHLEGWKGSLMNLERLLGVGVEAAPS